MIRLRLAHLIVLVILMSCNFAADSDIAANAVDRFHAAFNAEQYHDIYVSASDEFQSATKETDWSELLAAVRRKLGRFESGSQQTVNVVTTNSVTAVNQVYAARFSDGTATEWFSWAIRGRTSVLVGYRIESPLLITR